MTTSLWFSKIGNNNVVFFRMSKCCQPKPDLADPNNHRLAPVTFVNFAIAAES
jgi:hypothetical protein